VIVLDTNVVSELLTSRPNPRVVAWVDARRSAELTITAITAAELRAGATILSAGRRRTRIVAQVDELIDETFAGYMLSFDSACSAYYADVIARRRRTGAPISESDALIAAICRRESGSLATRNGRDFAGTGVEVIDPWPTKDA
jgi:toxin FitB